MGCALEVSNEDTVAALCFVLLAVLVFLASLVGAAHNRASSTIERARAWCSSWVNIK